MQWYAVNTKPYQEHQAALNLKGHGVEIFCPQIRQKKLIRRREQTVVGPLFPGYLFARFNMNAQFRAVTYARGVRKIVTFGTIPAIVDDEIIESIRTRLHDGYLTVPLPLFKQGQIVRIEEGPLHGLEAIFERQMGDHQRAVLLLQTLAYQARVVVPLKQVVNVQSYGSFEGHQACRIESVRQVPVGL